MSLSLLRSFSRMPVADTAIFVALNVAILLVPLLFTCVYTVCDDTALIYLASGGYTGEPTPYLVYTNVVLGWIYKSLYSLTKSVEWYSVAQYAFHIFVMNVMLGAVLRIRQTPLKYASLLLLAVMAFFLSRNFQYTTIAGELSISAMLLLLSGEKRLVRLSFVSFALACLTRTSGAMLAVMIFLPFLLLPVRSASPEYRRRLGALCLYALIAAGCFAIDKVAYSSPEWKAYTSYNDVRQYFNGNPSERDIDDFFSGNASEAGEYFLISRGYKNDGRIISQERFEQARDYLRGKRLENVKKNVSPYLQAYGIAGIALPLLLLILAAIAAGSSATTKKERLWRVASFLLVFCMFVIANIFCMSRAYAKERVLIVMAFSVVVIAIATLAKYGNSKLTAIPACLLAAALALRMANHDYLGSRNIKAWLAATEETKRILRQVDQPKVLYQDGIPVQMDMFHISGGVIAEKSLSISWLTNYPLTHKYYHGLKSAVDSGLPMLDRKDCCDDMAVRQQLLRDYYHIDTRIDTLADTENFIMYKLVGAEEKRGSVTEKSPANKM